MAHTVLKSPKCNPKIGLWDVGRRDTSSNHVGEKSGITVCVSRILCEALYRKLGKYVCVSIIPS